MHVLDLAKGVLDQVLGHRRRDAREEQECWFQCVVRADKDPRVAAVVAGSVAVPSSVVPRKIFKVCLLLDKLETSKENAVAETLFQEAQAVSGEDATGADLVQLVAPVGPHGFILAFEHLGDFEADAEGVEGGGHEGLDGARCEAGGEGGGQWRWGIDAFGVLGGRGVEGGEGSEVGGVEDGADGSVGY